MRARNIIILTVLLAVSAAALLIIYRPRIITNQPGIIGLSVADQTQPDQTHIFTLSTNGGYIHYRPVKVHNVWSVSPSSHTSAPSAE